VADYLTAMGPTQAARRQKALEVPTLSTRVPRSCYGVCIAPRDLLACSGKVVIVAKTDRGVSDRFEFRRE